MAWGVDSARPANAKALDGSSGFDSVTQTAGASPIFWGRYIGGNFAITAVEAAFLQAKACKILPVYNGTSNDAGSVQGGIAEGQADANDAADAAQALAVPAGVAIYADVEGEWAVTPEWMRGWATGINARNYVSGFYGNCTPGSTFAQAFCVAQAAEPAVAGSLLWSMEPEPNPQCQAAAAAPDFAPAIPDCGGNVVMWQYTENCWQEILGVNAGIDMNIALDAAVAVMW